MSTKVYQFSISHKHDSSRFSSSVVFKKKTCFSSLIAEKSRTIFCNVSTLHLEIKMEFELEDLLFDYDTYYVN